MSRQDARVLGRGSPIALADGAITISVASGARSTAQRRRRTGYFQPSRCNPRRRAASWCPQGLDLAPRATPTVGARRRRSRRAVADPSAISASAASRGSCPIREERDARDNETGSGILHGNGPILDKYQSLDAATRKSLGQPKGNEQKHPDDGGGYQEFEHDRITWKPGDAEATVVNS
ncbi:LGFP repeat-containing protein [Candidatus Mycobacterium methanotrophicum]|uniref:Uncharacterized protein n=1 Tax=Candidatus Mycobacterium methanotrophicum TaxID=2943498 RepID=A0ABY4QNZ0_9MYCO|nr:hypothetical protein [Candidatus Mycobacterium methanotrophicum]UQX12023.1 hypothetical protein M5I08_06670 [Candidatus Mycobacterium methanotrophicum]